MELLTSAISGLVGGIMGSLITTGKEILFRKAKTDNNAKYLIIRVVCELDRYTNSCAQVVGDTGVGYEMPDEDGGRTPQVPAPKLDLGFFDVDWKCLPIELLYEVLNFPQKDENARQIVNNIFDFADHHAEYADEAFEERQFQYAGLGIEASQLATKLREQLKLPERNVTEWNSITYMRDHFDKIERKKQTAKIPNIENWAKIMNS